MKFPPASIEDGVSMSGVLEDHENDGKYFGDMMKQYLDQEWVEQDVHKRLGQFVTDRYIASRKEGVDDVGEMLMRIGIGLESFDMSEAYVNGWDVANKLSDLIMLKLDREVCSCGLRGPPLEQSRSSMETFMSLKERMQSTELNLVTEFNRYKHLQEFLDREVSWNDMSYTVAIVLGYRMDRAEGSDSYAGIYVDTLARREELTPFGWEDLPRDRMPTLNEDTARASILARMEADLPENAEATDVIIDSVAGVEYHKILKNSGNVDDLHRIAVCKWLYVHNFLGGNFPHDKRFLPYHMDEEDFA
jgi:hypothetical protein